MLRALSTVRSALTPVARSAIITPRALSRVATLFDRHRLIESLEEEINDEKENGTAAELPSTFEGFSVSHRLGSPMITLQSEADGDKVVVRININECPMEALEDSDDADEVTEAASPVPQFSIDVINAAGMTMTAECTLTHGDLVINRVGYTPAGVAATEAHDAVYMNDAAYLDDGLYDSVSAFLEGKGVNGEFCDFVEGVIADKEYLEYLKWLQQGQAFLK